MEVRKRKDQSSSTSKKSPQKSNNNKEGKAPFKGSFNPKLGGHGRRPESTADSTMMSHSTWTRLVMVASVFTVAYFSSHKSGDGSARSVMAKVGEFIDEKRQMSSLCAPSFKREIRDLHNEACLPKACGRFVTDSIVTSDEAHHLLELAKKGLAKGGSNGGASILDLHSGALSKGDQFLNFYKVHPNVFKKSDFDIYNQVQEKVRMSISSHFGIAPASLHLTHPTFFSRLTGRDPSTPHDEYWHLHVDKETYPAFHYTSLLYLTDFDADFKGGDFVFVDVHDKMNRTIQPRLGRVSAFTSGVENKHFVERVTGGVRYALTMGFTCDKEKAISPPGQQLAE